MPFTKWRPGPPLRAASEVAGFVPAADWLAASVVPPLPAADWLPAADLDIAFFFSSVFCRGAAAVVVFPRRDGEKFAIFGHFLPFFWPFFYLLTRVLAALHVGELLSALPSSALRRDGGSGTRGTSAWPGSRQGPAAHGPFSSAAPLGAAFPATSCPQRTRGDLGLGRLLRYGCGAACGGAQQ